MIRGARHSEYCRYYVLISFCAWYRGWCVCNCINCMCMAVNFSFLRIYITSILIRSITFRYSSEFANKIIALYAVGSGYPDPFRYPPGHSLPSASRTNSGDIYSSFVVLHDVCPDKYTFGFPLSSVPAQCLRYQLFPSVDASTGVSIGTLLQSTGGSWYSALSQSMIFFLCPGFPQVS